MFNHTFIKNSGKPFDNYEDNKNLCVFNQASTPKQSEQFGCGSIPQKSKSVAIPNK